MSDKYPRQLSTSVDEDTYEWFAAQARAEYRNVSSHLRYLVERHRADVEGREQRVRAFGDAVARTIPVDPAAPARVPYDPTSGPGGYPPGKPYAGSAPPGTTETWSDPEAWLPDPEEVAEEEGVV